MIFSFCVLLLLQATLEQNPSYHNLSLAYQHNGTITIPFAEIQLNKSKELWRSLMIAANTLELNRDSQVRNALKKAAGVYTSVQSDTLLRTVVVTVIEMTNSTGYHGKYKLMLHNYMCYLRQFKIKNVLYILQHNNSTEFETETSELLTNFKNYVQILSYPYELFWKLVSAKNSVIREGWNAADYTGDFASFKHFGALVMLVRLSNNSFTYIIFILFTNRFLFWKCCSKAIMLCI
jgi:hypothetical protein